ncbi:MAG: C40 family peptidase [Bacteroidales bacterium]|nr:C40 family peptidase [Bacteroidales bacterium]
MRYGICKLSVVPMRKEASHTSELVSELLFNDIYSIIDENEEWLKIQCLYDSYEGWIRKLQHEEITDNELQDYISREKYIVNMPTIYHEDMILSFGSKVFEKIDGTIPLSKTFSSDTITESAFKMLNVPYRWGGKSIMGIDCSAFVQLCAKIAGYKLPRDASQQYDFGDTVDLSEAQSGDIAFFENKEHRIIHVGILLSRNMIIHASGKVRIDTIDETGIFNMELNTYTHYLCKVKRLK